MVSVIDSAISGGFLLGSSLLILNTLNFYRPKGSRYIHVVAWCITLTILSIVLSRAILVNILDEYPGYETFFKASLSIRACIEILLLGCVSLIGMLWNYTEEQKTSEQRKQDAEKMTKEAELFKLRQQLQPHFLFNSLNSINALIGSRPQEARKMIQQLSEFLRGTLKKEEHQWVTLQEELQYLQLYLDIEKVRFANRLVTIIETNEETLKMQLPALLLQPLVENAIKFGLYDTTGEAVIKIYTAKNDHDLIIKIINPFDASTAAPNKGIGFGLSSVSRRLFLLFARKDLLTTATEENLFITIVKIPQHV